MALALALVGGCAPALPRATANFEAYESAEKPGWMQIHSGPGRFEVLLPAAPRRGKSGPWTTLRAYSLGRRFAVAHRDHEDLGNARHRYSILESTAGGFQQEASDWRSPENIQAFGQPGRKIIFLGKDKRWTSVRLLVVGTRLYELYVAGAPGEPLPEEDAAVFFHSFQPLR